MLAALADPDNDDNETLAAKRSQELRALPLADAPTSQPQVAALLRQLLEQDSQLKQAAEARRSAIAATLRQLRSRSDATNTYQSIAKRK
nr:flagellar protein FliT [Motiliproteus sediminis]